MTSVLGAALLGLGVLALLALPRHLRAASWPTRSPATALLLWQAAFATGLLGILGAGIFLGLRPLRADVPHAVVEAANGRLLLEADVATGRFNSSVLAITLIASALVTTSLTLELAHRARVRRRQRVLVDWLATDDPTWPGVAVVDYSTPAAYSIPGRRWRIVVTRGLLDELTEDQVRVVLAHERAHAQQRHQWVTLLFAVAVRCRIPRARAAYEEVRGLLEMRADDAVRRSHADQTLARALVHLSQAASAVQLPPGSFAAADRRSADRVRRLLTPVAGPRWLPPVGITAAVTLVAAPVMAVAVPCLMS